jgi:hypothetical protein
MKKDSKESKKEEIVSFDLSLVRDIINAKKEVLKALAYR